nr:hypothetical protein [Winogradskyella wandonensis]
MNNKPSTLLLLVEQKLINFLNSGRLKDLAEWSSLNSLRTFRFLLSQ